MLLHHSALMSRMFCSMWPYGEVGAGGAMMQKSLTRIRLSRAFSLTHMVCSALVPCQLTATAYLRVGSVVHGVIGRICHSLKVDDADLLGLPNPVSSGNGLLLVLGVGVGVIHHHSVCCLQVQASAGCPDAQQEDEDLAVGCVEALDGNFPALHRAQPSISHIEA